ncbi:predicted protein [Plenodomus lingam JN3]|uniref:Predicted protein n=1 Tax=Leptosphaeria maculans (strain JN3 / isolate v23.1.3 / race Av1-4-5-6-7-8) TaxID=985895 RepID=E5AEM8_LEPMJ|nr:predicted protein [Plenodomus lingam JN3]CBY01667.1 predicted protein [Plenodomus lingam JN3]
MLTRILCLPPNGPIPPQPIPHHSHRHHLKPLPPSRHFTSEIIHSCKVEVCICESLLPSTAVSFYLLASPIEYSYLPCSFQKGWGGPPIINPACLRCLRCLAFAQACTCTVIPVSAR